MSKVSEIYRVALEEISSGAPEGSRDPEGHGGSFSEAYEIGYDNAHFEFASVADTALKLGEASELMEDLHGVIADYLNDSLAAPEGLTVKEHAICIVTAMRDAGFEIKRTD